MSNIKNEMDMLSAMIDMLGGVESTPEKSAVSVTHRNPVESTECRDSEGNPISFCGMPNCVSRREWLRAQKELETLREWKTMMENKIEKAKYVKKISARKARADKALSARTQPQ